jgi:hypothetical protein
MKTFGGILIAVGFLITLGAIGTSDREMAEMVATPTPFWHLALQAAIGLIVAVVGAAVLKRSR